MPRHIVKNCNHLFTGHRNIQIQAGFLQTVQIAVFQGGIPVAAIPLAAASRLLQNSRIGLNVTRAEVAGQHGKKLSPGHGACRTVFAVSNTAYHLCPGCFLDCRISPMAGGHITECRGCSKGGYCHSRAQCCRDDCGQDSFLLHILSLPPTQ